MSLHVRGEMAQRLVEVVHLRQDAHGGDDHEDVCRGVRELIVPVERQLQGDAESLDRHDGDGADEGADAQEDQGVLLPVDGRDLVDGDERVRGDDSQIEQEA